jgi:hypothetical protein
MFQINLFHHAKLHAAFAKLISEVKFDDEFGFRRDTRLAVEKSGFVLDLIIEPSSFLKENLESLQKRQQ